MPKTTIMIVKNSDVKQTTKKDFLKISKNESNEKISTKRNELTIYKDRRDIPKIEPKLFVAKIVTNAEKTKIRTYISPTDFSRYLILYLIFTVLKGKTKYK